MARVLGRIRLSRLTEESTSKARQEEVIEAWAKAHGHEIVGWAVDLDVSGSVSPFEAPAFGPWLREPGQYDWDIVAAWRLDRIGRRAIPLNRLFGWCNDHGKTLVSVTENIDLSNWVGRMVANVIAHVAEGELEATKERTQGSQAKLRELGRWHGGTPPFGYRAVKQDDGWRLEVREDEAALVREVARRAADGHSIRSLAGYLDNTGAAPRRGGPWTPQTVTRMLRSRWVLGQQEHRGKAVIGDDGMPLQRAEPILEHSVWQAVQAVLDDRSRPKRRSNPSGLLLNVAACSLCDAPLYHNVMHMRGTRYRYWRCSGKAKRQNGCPATGVPADDLEAFVAEQILGDIGDYERTELVYVPGSEVSDELDQVERAVEGIRKERDLGLYDGDDESYYSRLSALVARRKKLADTPATPAQWVRRGLGETYRDAWARMDTDERRKLLLDAGVTVTARAKPFEANVHVDVEALRSQVPTFEPPSTG